MTFAGRGAEGVMEEAIICNEAIEMNQQGDSQQDLNRRRTEKRWKRQPQHDGYHALV